MKLHAAIRHTRKAHVDRAAQLRPGFSLCSSALVCAWLPAPGGRNRHPCPVGASRPPVRATPNVNASVARVASPAWHALEAARYPHYHRAHRVDFRRLWVSIKVPSSVNPGSLRSRGTARSCRRDLRASGRLVGYEMTRRFYEIGSFAGLAETSCLLSPSPALEPDPK